MARTPGGLMVRRAVLLLRCQQARERRQQLEVRAAERAHAAVLEEIAAAADALRNQTVDAEQARAAAHDGLRGQIVDAHSLLALASFEDGLKAETAACIERQRVAEAQREEAECTLDGARAALATVARIAAKRARFAEALQLRCRRAREVAEEAVRDEERADAWRAA